MKARRVDQQDHGEGLVVRVKRKKRLLQNVLDANREPDYFNKRSLKKAFVAAALHLTASCSTQMIQKYSQTLKMDLLPTNAEFDCCLAS